LANRLAHETSPYLLQHAGNPVDWHPWGREALERARSEDRPVLLSIGYSACHWCHVMERESFADPVTAGIMNDGFVCIKVDREERPDVDGIYMRAVQALTGQGGWPLTAFLTPEGEPFYGGTYFPPEPRQGMPSFAHVLRAISEAWRNRRDELLDNAHGLRDALQAAARTGGIGVEVGSGGPGDRELADRAFRHLRERFDEAHGGFGGGPKFPQPTTLEFLLAHGVAHDEPAAVDLVVRTLHAMAAGGLRDHLGGGFHRYTVDARWLVPHFEKMLYDNALLARLYLDGWRVTGDPTLRRVAEETLGWILADLWAPEGGFYSARDADSEGEEGVFYLWTPDEVEAAAPDAAAARLFRRVYDVQAGGNFEGGRSILHLPHALEAVARSEGIGADELDQRLAPVRAAHRAPRAGREPPFRDEKILCSWSAFAVRALAEAGGALGRDDWVDAAREAASFLLEALRPEGELLHVWTAGSAKVPAFLDDRAALANACLSLHEATLEPRWLDEAARLCEEALARHHDPQEGLFYDDAAGGEHLLVRPREIMDQATPSGTALAVEALLRAAHLLDRDDWASVARAAVDRERSLVERFPSAFGRLLTQIVRMDAAPVEVAVMGPRSDPRTRALRTAALDGYHPRRVVTGADPATDEVGQGSAGRDAGADSGDGPSPAGPPLLRGRGLLDGAPAAWVCHAYRCDAPVSEPERVRELVAARF
jgi:hypothetical protein